MRNESEQKGKLIDQWIIATKIGLTIATLWGVHEVVIHLAQPVSRFLAVEALSLAGPETAEVNANYMPLRDQIEDAISVAEADGVDVYYEKYDLDITSEQIAKIGYLITKHEIGNILSEGELNGQYFKYMTEAVIADQLRDESPDFVSTILRAGSDFQNFDEMTQIPGSGFHRRNTPKDDLVGFIEYIEDETATNQGNPLPQWKLLKYWLVLNNGNLREALYDKSIALKALARNKIEGETLSHNNVDESDENVLFMTENILDQASLTGSYSDTYLLYGHHNINPDLSVLDMIGTQYREDTLVALLDRFPPSFVVAMSEAQELSQRHKEGSVKIASNLTATMGLYELAEYLNTIR